MSDLTFLLGKGEKIIKDLDLVFYSGVGYVNVGLVSGIGGSISGGVLGGGGIFSGKQIKREGSLWDSKPAHLYITNKRIIFCNAKVSMWSHKETDIGTPFTEVPYDALRGLTKTKKLGMPSIDISFANPNGIENAKFWFHGAGAVSKSDEAERRRDDVFNLIKKQLK